MKPKVLILEDQVPIYELLMRVFQNTLPVTEMEFTHASSIEAACGELSKPWDIILADYALGASFRPEGSDKDLRTGADLVKARRTLEKEGKIKPAYIIGMAPSAAANTLLVSMGANSKVLKVQMMDLSSMVAERIK